MKKRLTVMLAVLWIGIAANAQTETKDSTTVKTENIMEQNDSTMAKLNALDSIAKGVKDGYLLVENGVVKGYKAMETGIVKGFTEVNDAITLKLFGKDGETIDQTKARLNSAVEASRARSREILEKNMKATEEAVKNAAKK